MPWRVIALARLGLSGRRENESRTTFLKQVEKMHRCQSFIKKESDSKEKELCGSLDTKVIYESKYLVLYHCNECRMNSVEIKETDDEKRN